MGTSHHQDPTTDLPNMVRSDPSQDPTDLLPLALRQDSMDRRVRLAHPSSDLHRVSMDLLKASMDRHKAPTGPHRASMDQHRASMANHKVPHISPTGQRHLCRRTNSFSRNNSRDGI